MLKVRSFAIALRRPEDHEKDFLHAILTIYGFVTAIGLAAVTARCFYY